ncbi:hypothetical protein M1N70_03445 [Peptococcaceae bacterium]|nr:hypothetical protein [Peptococcaceae bacterium]
MTIWERLWKDECYYYKVVAIVLSIYILCFEVAPDFIDFITSNTDLHQGCRYGRTTLGIVKYDTPLEVRFPDFKAPGPCRLISRFDVSVIATDVDVDARETVRVYLVGTNTREVYYLGTLDRAGDGEQEWTSIRVPDRDEDIVDQIIKENDGLISIGFVMENRSRNASINYVSIFIDW